MSIKFEDNSIKVFSALDNAVFNALEECAGELENQVKMNTKVKTGKTKGSWDHVVIHKKYEAQVGSNYENAIWEEYGTGIHAEKGNGRKDVPWIYKDEEGNWHRTSGKKPRRPFRKAINQIKPAIKRYFEERFKDL